MFSQYNRKNQKFDADRFEWFGSFRVKIGRKNKDLE